MREPEKKNACRTCVGPMCVMQVLFSVLSVSFPTVAARPDEVVELGWYFLDGGGGKRMLAEAVASRVSLSDFSCGLKYEARDNKNNT